MRLAFRVRRGQCGLFWNRRPIRAWIRAGEIDASFRVAHYGLTVPYRGREPAQRCDDVAPAGELLADRLCDARLDLDVPPIECRFGEACRFKRQLHAHPELDDL